MRANRPAWLVACVLLATPVGAADITAHELLDRMNDAIRTLDYEGRFVVQAGEQMDAMYIVHRVDDGSEKERVVSLTGQPREVIRSDQAVACLIAGGERSIRVGRPAQGRSLSPLRGVSAAQLEMSYRLRVLEPERVAGRDAHQVQIDPHDDLRYGYRLFIDQGSSLPLRSVMLDGAGQVVSQMMFVELKVGETVTPIERDLSAMQLARAERSAPLAAERLAPAAWVFPDLPPGFQLNVHRRRPLDPSGAELEHFIFSDGLATVSVYIQPLGRAGALSGESSLGSARAVGRLAGDHEIIVVGEVPAKTLHWFAQGVQPASP